MFLESFHNSSTKNKNQKLIIVNLNGLKNTYCVFETLVLKFLLILLIYFEIGK